MPDEAFDLVADAGCRVLVLGSFPGAQSLRDRRYYANPRNQFWHLMSPVVGVDLVPLAYDQRLATLVSRYVGLWDVVDSANRAGSLDSALRDIMPRNLGAVIARLPDLRVLAFNGATAFRIGQRQLGLDAGVACVLLPSSSPAHAIGLGAKSQHWARLAESLEP
jgi:hypoxanthine-DNA glycosylase